MTRKYGKRVSPMKPKVGARKVTSRSHGPTSRSRPLNRKDAEAIVEVCSKEWAAMGIFERHEINGANILGWLLKEHPELAKRFS